jgi:hypothetical protein
VFGNPFHPLSPMKPAMLAWNDGLIVRLAEAAYDDRELPSGRLTPDRLGVLGDALEEFGGVPGLVEHLRKPGPHCRGCHVVDGLLGLA